MRLHRLDLKAFGPFTDQSLSFNQDGNLQFVYGLNEAGKSSALRAVQALLYGIPLRTSDDFVHDKPQLRVGALIRLDDGSPLEVVRRKGQRGTLLDPDGNTLADTALPQLLGGVDVNYFRTMFGIDHSALVEGGEELLKSEGGASEAVFSAGTGLRGVRQLLETLQGEADDLFSPRGRTKKINKALADHDALLKRSREARLRAEDYVRHREARASAEAKKQEFEHDLARLRVEIDELERVQKAHEVLPKWRSLNDDFGDYKDATLLREDFSQHRVKAQEALRTARLRVDKERERIERIDAKIEQLEIPHDLLAQEKLIDTLYQRIDAVGKGRQDEPEQRRKRDEALQKARAVLHAVCPGVELDKAERFRLPAAARMRIQNLGNEHKALHQEREGARKAEGDLQRQLTEAKEARQAMDAIGNPAELRAAVTAVQRLGDVEVQRRRCASELQSCEDRANAELKSLPLWGGTLEALCVLPLPAEETIERFESELGELDDAIRTAKNEAKRSEADIADCEREIQQVLGRGGEVPTDEDVHAARARRDEGWRFVLRSWLDSEDVTEQARPLLQQFGARSLANAYEAAMRRADEVVDRVRSEAERVAQMAQLRLKREGARVQLEQQQQALSVQGKRRDAIKVDWQTHWQPAGIDPLPPKEMRAWCRRQGDLAELANAIRERKQEFVGIESQIGEARASLVAALRALAESEPAPDATLAVVLERCDQRSVRLEEQLRARDSLDDKIARLERERTRAGSRSQAGEAQFERWRGEWENALRPLGLGADTTPETATKVLEEINSLFREVDRASAARGRTEQMQSYIAEFEQQTTTLAESVAPDLRDTPAEQAVAILRQRCDDGRDRQNALAEWRKQRLRAEEDGHAYENEVRTHTATLDALCREAGCESPDQLPDAERHSDERRRIEGELTGVRDQLRLLAGGRPLKEFLATVENAEPATLSANIARRQEKLGDVQGEISSCDRAIGEADNELSKMVGGSESAELLQEAQNVLAGIRGDALHYARLRFAAAILRHAMERYRERHQNPLVRLAGQIFRRLTCGSFDSLVTDLDDQDRPVLYGVRARQRLKVGQMSDGTRDQLYLALRLASLERYLEHNPPLPFIVDDVLVNFDDERAGATLGELANLAKKTQVLFFTHHEHLVNSARSLLGEDRMAVVHLERTF